MKSFKTLFLTAVVFCALVFAGCSGGGTASSSGSSSTGTSSSSYETSSSGTSSSSGEADSTSSGEAGSTSSGDTGSISSDDGDSVPLFEGDYVASECVELGQYKGLKLIREIEEITDARVNAYIKQQMEPVALTDPDARAEEGDTVNIDYAGEKDGVPFEGGTSEGTDLVLGSNQFIDGFEDGVIGMKAGETKDLNLTFPEDYGSAELAGEDVVFHVTVNEILRPGEITEEWLKNTYGNEYKNVAEYKEKMKEELEQDAEKSADEDLHTTALNTAYGNAVFKKLPLSLIDKARNDFDQSYQQFASAYQLEFSEYLESQGVTQEQYDEERENYARDFASKIIFIEAIWDAEGMEQKGEDYDNVVNELSEMYGCSITELSRSLGEEQVENQIKIQMVGNFIVANSEVTDKTA